MDRLSSVDASFLYVENEFNHMAIAALGIFAGPAPAEGEIEAMIASKLDLVPRYRQRVRFVPFDLGLPVWSDDPHFQLGYHVRHSALPAPGSEEQLQTLVGRVMSQQLDRTKPLWEMWVVEGLENGDWAILLKLHHSMADGVAATDLLSLILDESASEEHEAAQPWQPEPAPSPASLVAGALVERMTSPTEILQTVRSGLEAPRRALRKLGEVADGLATFRSFTNTALESSLNGPVGVHRSWRWASASFADLKKIRAARGGTINDVVLAAITRGFRALLLSRGEPVDDLAVRTLVPVSIRKDDEHGELNNRVSAMFAELPVGIEDPVECLASIQTQLNDLKAHHQSAAGEALSSFGGLAPPVLMALASRLFAGLEQHAVQTVATNVPGPRHTLFAAGRPMRRAYLYVPLAGSVRMGVAIFSYAGLLTFGVTGDYDHAPDIDVLCRGIEAGIEELLATS